MRILALSPHTDDADLGAGGTLAQLVERGCKVWSVAFSAVHNQRLMTEFKAASEVLGIAEHRMTIYDFESRFFPEQRQEILQVMDALAKEIEPDLVLGPSSLDTHQDHKVIADEMVRAFKTISILGYELPWNNLSFETRAFVELSPGQMQKKLAALACYESQQHRTYLNEEFLTGLARTRGTQIQKTFAEAFEAVRWIL